MIDPVRITDYNRSDHELEELLLFCIAAAGKNATTTSRLLEKLLHWGFCYDPSPFRTIKRLSRDYNPLSELMRQLGFGCHTLKSRGFIEAACSGLDLRRCSVEELEEIAGIGMKTSRFFVLHTRKNANIACLDTHILKWMEYYTGYDVPNKTPSKTKYLELEQIFLQIAKTMKISTADLDLKIWNKQRGSDEESVVKAGKVKTK